MPEWAEVKIIRDGLQKFLGKEIKSLESLGTGKFKNHALAKNMNDYLQKQEYPVIEEIECHGKFLWWKLHWKNGVEWILSNPLGMTGGWSYTKNKHSQLSMLIDDEIIYFNDVRHFGNLAQISSKEYSKKLRSLGTDLALLNEDDVLRLANKNKITYNICVHLMNQANFSGVGNYIKNEALYRAGICPWRSNDLTMDESSRLIKEIKEVALESYQAGGCSVRDYFHLDGKIGSYQDQLKVYGRKKDPEGRDIIREKTPDGRSTYWVKGFKNENYTRF